MPELGSEIAAAAELLRRRHPEVGSFVAEPLPAHPWIRIARGVDSCAAMLPEISGASEPDLQLEHLRVRFNVSCSLEIGGESKTERLCIVECTSPDPRVQATFLEVVAVVLPDDGPETSIGALRDSVTSLAELFSAMLEPAARSVLGLWGELFVMSRAFNRHAAAAAWHTTPRDRYDFAAGHLRIEVKTTTGTRVHTFSLEQLVPPLNVQVIVGSVVTTPSPAGPSLEDLLERVVAGVGDSRVRSHVIATSMRSLGVSWHHARQTRFDDDLAEATFRWIDSRLIPRVADPPIEVREVRFKSDLQGCAALDEGELTALGDLGRAITTHS